METKSVEQIQIFLHSVSWGDETYTENGILFVPNNVQNYAVMPIDVAEWTEMLANEISEKIKGIGWKPGVLFYGKASEYDCDRLNYEASAKGFVIFWNGATNRIRYSEFLMKILDGINMFPDFT